MICAYLLYIRKFHDSPNALQFYAEKRTTNGKVGCKNFVCCLTLNNMALLFDGPDSSQALPNLQHKSRVDVISCA